MTRHARTTGKSLLAAARSLRYPPFQPAGHYYSPVTSPDDVQRAKEQRAGMAELDGVDLNAAAQRILAEKLAPTWAESASVWRRYRPDNSMYGLADAAIFYSLLGELRPRRIIEIGSGFSSALALDTRDAELPELELTFVEPNPDRLLGLLSDADRSRTTLYRQPVQHVPLDIYHTLQADDVLFIDSTHVAKAGSDVNWLFFRVLPRLATGVIVHVHDIFFPFEYLDEWLDAGRSWNESYLLRAFLTNSSAYEIVLFNSWLWHDQRALVRRHLPEAADLEPGGIWLRKIA
jgi:predicted O-methyltransferase YrrM